MERNLTSSAIVLTHRRWGDLHRLVTLLSADLGVFTAVAYGARKGKLAGGIEPGTIGNCFLYRNPTRNEYTLTDVDVIFSVDAIREDLRRLYAAHVMIEIAMRMHGGDYAALYQTLGTSLMLLQSPEVAPHLDLIQYIWRWISIMGLESDLTVCPICSTAYADDEILSFHAGMHTPCCAQCGTVDSSDFVYALGPGGRRYLAYTRTLAEADAVLVPLSETASARMLRYMIRYAETILGSSLKSLSGGISLSVLL
jgi:DNA repair protein RecO (recombination protein O)